MGGAAQNAREAATDGRESRTFCERSCGARRRRIEIADITAGAIDDAIVAVPRAISEIPSPAAPPSPRVKLDYTGESAALLLASEVAADAVAAAIWNAEKKEKEDAAEAEAAAASVAEAEAAAMEPEEENLLKKIFTGVFWMQLFTGGESQTPAMAVTPGVAHVSDRATPGKAVANAGAMARVSVHKEEQELRI